MSAINPDAQRALTEKRGKELDRWIEMKCIRFMRGIEPFSPTLSDLPSEILHHVVEKMEPMNRLKARKVCRSLKTVVDTIGTCFNYVDLRLYENKLDLMLDGIEIVYTNAANGSSNVILNGQKRINVGENFVGRALKDLKIVLKHARKIGIWNYSGSRRDIVTSLIGIFESKNCIHVKEIELNIFSFDEVLTILPCLDAKKLKKIKLLCIKSIDRFEQITQLEQWKNAEEIKLLNSKIASTMIVNFFHFKCFNIYELDEFPKQTAIQMRDDLLKRSTFQSCKIFFDKSKINPIEIAKVFKPDYAGGNDFRIEFSNGNDKFDISLEKPYNYHLNVKRLLK